MVIILPLFFGSCSNSLDSGIERKTKNNQTHHCFSPVVQCSVQQMKLFYRGPDKIQKSVDLKKN